MTYRELAVPGAWDTTPVQDGDTRAASEQVTDLIADLAFGLFDLS